MVFLVFLPSFAPRIHGVSVLVSFLSWQVLSFGLNRSEKAGQAVASLQRTVGSSGSLVPYIQSPTVTAHPKDTHMLEQ